MKPGATAIPSALTSFSAVEFERSPMRAMKLPLIAISEDIGAFPDPS